MRNALDVLKERGFVQQHTDEKELRELLSGPTTLYDGFDPSASSLHVGNLVGVMALAHLQRAGHRPIVVIGGGTGMVGDPSGKTEMRKLLTAESIQANLESQKKQFAKYLDFDSDKALIINNAEWLLELNYVEFLRDIGRHFSVNRMLSAEAYKIRMETGLSFLEFNYQLMQAYDYLVLFQRHGCRLQVGGDDQWGNILAGVDLVRRVESQQVHALTFPLLTTSDGKKMGKTERGAVWLDGTLLTPYDYYQYWVNVDDRDVARFLAIFTFLPMEEVQELGRLEGADIREAKRRLAFEATAVTHGVDEAKKAEAAAKAAFGSGAAQALENVPTTAVARDAFSGAVLDLFLAAGLTKSRGDTKRLIQQGGAYVNDRRIESLDETLQASEIEKGEVLLRSGKKKFHRLEIES